MNEDIKEVLYSKEAIETRVKELGATVTERYAYAVERGEEIVLVCVLRGAAIFMADLARAIDLPLAMDFMVVSSYGASTKSSGIIKIKKDLSEEIQGKHVIIAEDIIDSGLTLSHLLKMFEQRGATSVEVVALLRKDVPNQTPVPCLEVGFECPNEFIVGYGLDYAERYRNLPYIGILKPEVYS